MCWHFCIYSWLCCQLVSGFWQLSYACYRLLGCRTCVWWTTCCRRFSLKCCIISTKKTCCLRRWYFGGTNSAWGRTSTWLVARRCANRQVPLLAIRKSSCSKRATCITRASNIYVFAVQSCCYTSTTVWIWSATWHCAVIEQRTSTLPILTSIQNTNILNHTNPVMEVNIRIKTVLELSNSASCHVCTFCQCEFFKVVVYVHVLGHAISIGYFWYC